MPVNGQKCCSRAGCERPRASTHNYCNEHWAEYQRDYKAKHDKEKIEASFQQGLKNGVDACVRFCRERLGDRAITGNQAAQLLLRANQGESETAEAAQRRKMIESLQRPQA